MMRYTLAMAADPVLLVLDLAGTFAFALNGALTAVRTAHLDIVGVITLGIITAMGGGIIRDVLLGALPWLGRSPGVWRRTMTLLRAGRGGIGLNAPLGRRGSNADGCGRARHGDAMVRRQPRRKPGPRNGPLSAAPEAMDRAGHMVASRVETDVVASHRSHGRQPGRDHEHGGGQNRDAHTRAQQAEQASGFCRCDIRGAHPSEA